MLQFSNMTNQINMSYGDFTTKDQQVNGQGNQPFQQEQEDDVMREEPSELNREDQSI